MTIAYINAELEKLTASGILSPTATEACRQAGSLLTTVRNLVLSALPEGVIIERIEALLVEQGDA